MKNSITFYKKPWFWIVCICAIIAVVYGMIACLDSRPGVLIKPSNVIKDDTAEEIITQYLIDEQKNEDTYGECPTAGIVILHTEIDKTYGDDEYDEKVYTLTSESCFGFEQDYFVEESGSRVPAVFTLHVDEDSSEVMDCEYPGEGSDYGPSLKKMFPKTLWKTVIDVSDVNIELMWKKCTSQAQKYLDSMGRGDTKICSWGDVEHIIFTDIGMPVEVSNEFINNFKFQNFYEYIGTKETLENGKRFVYRTVTDDGVLNLVFTKEDYETGEVLKKIVVDLATGEIVGLNNNSEEFVKKFSSYINLEANDGLKVLFWKMAEESNHYVLVSAETDNKTVEENILSYPTATAEEMKEILSLYTDFYSSEYIKLQPITALHSSYAWDYEKEFTAETEKTMRSELGI